MTEVKGHCEDCYFKRQEWSIDDGHRIVLGDEEPTVEWAQNMHLQIDTFCDLFDAFVPKDGYCHGFKREITL